MASQLRAMRGWLYGMSRASLAVTSSYENGQAGEHMPASYTEDSRKLLAVLGQFAGQMGW